MLKKDITFNDFDGNEITETHYFHMTQADLVKMDMSRKGGMQVYVARIVAAQDGKEIIEVFDELLRMSYGTRTPEGRFVRNQTMTEEFMGSEAYSALFMELVTDAAASAEFVNAIIPQGLEQAAAKLKQSSATQVPTPTPAPAVQVAEQANAVHEAKDDPTGLSDPSTPQILTASDVMAMDVDELKSGLATGRYTLS